MTTKSLKNFHGNDVEEEVKKWTFEDCSEYIRKHKEDYKKNEHINQRVILKALLKVDI